MNFTVIGSAHGHIYEMIDSMLKAGVWFVGIFNDGTDAAAAISRKYCAPLFNRFEDLLKPEIDVVGSAAVNSQIFYTGTKGCLEAGILGDPISRKPEVVLLWEGDETARLKYAAAGNSSTFDFLSRINKQIIK